MGIGRYYYGKVGYRVGPAPALGRAMAGRAGITVISLAVALGSQGCLERKFTPDPGFVDLYVDLKVASVAYAGEPAKAATARRIILAQHHATAEDFHRQYRELEAHPEAWKGFQERVLAGLDEFEKRQAKGARDGK